ncbi:MAG TPA: hypothetical protein VLT33_15920 [Labilithrix sp.]|nr:hypothetical protein [Labilithrix sp.]
MHRFPLVAGALLTVAAASPAVAAPPADAPFTYTSDLVLAAARGKLTLSPLAADGDWASASPRGGLVVVGKSNDSGITQGDAGRGFLFPGRRPIPIPELEGRITSFSSDGAYLLVGAGYHHTRASAGAPWTPPNPTVAVLSVPDLRVVQQIAGMDPMWIGPSTVAFRRGNQPMRLDLARGGAPVAVGVAQTTYGCTYESFGPKTPCTSGNTTSFTSVDPGLSGWLVEDSCTLVAGAQGYTSMCKPTEAVRVLDLATARSRTLVAVQGVEDHLFTYVSPNRSRACFWVTLPATISLSCMTLPSGKRETVFSGPTPADARLGGTSAWLDDQRVLLLHDGTVTIADLAAHTLTRVVGVPAGAGSVTPLAGGKRLVFRHPGLAIVDLDARTWFTGAGGADPDAFPVPGSDRRFVLRERVSAPRSAPQPLHWVDL